MHYETKYKTDLTNEQWDVIAPLFSNIRKYKWNKRELVNAVLYLVKTGCQWRNLPHDFPSIFTVHSFYRRARLNGLWDKIFEHLVKLTREKNERSKTANCHRRDRLSFICLDSQSEFTRYKNGLVGSRFSNFRLSYVGKDLRRR